MHVIQTVFFSSGSGHLDCSAHILLQGDPNAMKLFPLETAINNNMYCLNVFNAHGSSSLTAYVHVYQHSQSYIHIF